MSFLDPIFLNANETFRRRAAAAPLRSLGSEVSPRGREVIGPRTPWSLHLAASSRTPWLSTSASSTTSTPEDATPRTPVGEDQTRPLRGAASPKTAEPRRSSTGAAPTEEDPAVTKSQSGRAASTPAPPASDPHTPRLYVHRDPSIPRPRAAGAAAGGRGIERIAGDELRCAREPKKSPFLTVGGERELVQGPIMLFLR